KIINGFCHVRGMLTFAFEFQTYNNCKPRMF
ncbi:MAG: hypothetical protein ACI9A7_000528, partial [Cyclobacteriaceae bacterium]